MAKRFLSALLALLMLCASAYADVECYHLETDFRNNNGKCEEYCLNCDATLEIGIHQAQCKEPGVCWRCGYRDANIGIAIHGNSVIGNNEDNMCECSCEDCGKVYWVDPHEAYCDEPGKCYWCDYVSADIETVYHTGHAYRNNADGMCELYCADCNATLDVDVHKSRCSAPNICVECEHEAAGMMVAYHSDPINEDVDGKCVERCGDCGETAWVDEHEAYCVVPGECWVCGYKSDNIKNIYHGGDSYFQNNENGMCEEICFECGKPTGYVTNHEVYCDNPNKCVICSYTSESLRVTEHQGEYHVNADGDCEYYCPECGKVFWIGEHEASCDALNVCIFCENVLDNITVLAHDTAFRNNSQGLCETYCTYCKTVISTDVHSAHCEDPDVCRLCGFTAPGMAIGWHELEYRNTADGKCQQYCSVCDDIFWTAEHWSYCNEPNFCYNCGGQYSNMRIEHKSDCDDPDHCKWCGTVNDGTKPFYHTTRGDYDYYPIDGTYHTVVCQVCNFSNTEGHSFYFRNPDECYLCGGAVHGDDETDIDPREAQYNYVYDYEYYAAQNADVAAVYVTRKAIFEHFLTSGMAEGRPSHPEFNVNYYIANNPDLTGVFGDNLKEYYLHFQNNGKAEGRVADVLLMPAVPSIEEQEAAYSYIYSFSYYTSQNPDIGTAFSGDRVATLAHFVEHGMAEGRPSHADFNVDYYIANNPDLKDAFGGDLKAYYMHFQNNGKAEGRIADHLVTQPTPEPDYAKLEAPYSNIYNYSYYCAQNPDVAAVYGDRAAILQHFIDNGMAEGRPSHAGFNVNYYIANNPDLKDVFGGNLKAYYLHFQNNGKAEGRIADHLVNPPTPEPDYAKLEAPYSNIYNYSYYCTQNPDVAAVCGDRAAILQHFIDNGMAEGRPSHAGFNVNYYIANNQDLVPVLGNGLKAYYMHYQNYGKAEGRIADRLVQQEDPNSKPDSREAHYAPVYNYEYYLANNPDVKAAFDGNRTATMDHFINSGMAEGRRASSEFNVHAYRANYPDLQAAFGDNLKAYYNHYINSGKAEGRYGK